MIGPDREPGETGAALVAAIVALTAAAAIVAGLYLMTASANSLAGSQGGVERLQSAADGVVNLCSSIVDSVLGVGDFQDQSLADGTDVFGGFTLTVLDGNLAAELADVEPTTANRIWYGERAGPGSPFVPDVRLTQGPFTAELDIDLLAREVAAGEATEFGSRANVGGGGSNQNVYRCLAHVTDPDGRIAVSFGTIRKEF